MAGKSAGFAIGVSISDTASAGLDAINKRIAAMSAPAERFNKSLAKFGEVTEINRAAEGVQTLGDRLLGAARAAERLAGPMAGITGATSLGGIAALTKQWADAGNTISKTANLMNTPVGTLSRWRIAAGLAGSTADKLDASWAGMSKTLSDAFWNKPGDSKMRLNSLGINWRDEQGNMKTTEAALRELADKTASYKDPRDQAHALEFGGVDTDLLKLFAGGQKGLDAFLQEATATGAEWTKQMAGNAATVRHAWTRLGDVVVGVGMQIADSWSGTATKVLDTTADWIKGLDKLSAAEKQRLTAVTAAVGAVGALKVAPWVLRALGWLLKGETVPLLVVGAIGDGGANLPPNPNDFFTRQMNSPWTHVNPDGTIGAGPANSSDSPSANAHPGWSWLPTLLGGSGGAGAPNLSSSARHNPLNLRFAGQPGASQTSSGFGAYGSDEQGVAAAERQLLLYRNRHITKLGDIISTWAPPKENDTAGYIARVAARTGWGADQDIDVSDPRQAGALIGAMAPTETHALDPAVVGRGVAFGLGRVLDPATVGAAQSGAVHVTVDIRGAPHGTTGTSVGTGSVTVSPPRVEHAMPMAGGPWS